jgi:hypothetical protein
MENRVGQRDGPLGRWTSFPVGVLVTTRADESQLGELGEGRQKDGRTEIWRIG